MIGRLLVFALLLGLLWLGYWFYQVAPSDFENEGDAFMQTQDYSQASLMYARALKDSRASYSEERVLFKLGNSYRIQGERDRAFDFYFMLLRQNPNSIYKERIEEYLREQKGLLTSNAENLTVEIDWSFLQNSQEAVTLEQVVEQRHRIYRHLLDKIMASAGGGASYEALELYSAFRKNEVQLLELKEQKGRELSVQATTIRPRLISLVAADEDTIEKIRKSDLPFPLKVDALATLDDVFAYSSSNQAVEGLFLFLRPEDMAMAEIHVPRIGDLYENSKIFLIFVDEGEQEQLGESPLVKDSRFRWFSCSDSEDCVHTIRDSLRLKSLWQSNG